MKPSLPSSQLTAQPKIDMPTADSSPLKPVSTIAELPLTEEKGQVWNTKNLGLRLASDAACGVFAATLVAPIITAVDKYVSPLSLRVAQLT
jgi:hypothetical protein